MSRFLDAKIAQTTTIIDQRMSQASQQLGSFSQSTADVLVNWQLYASLEPSQQTLIASGVEFSAKAKALVDDRKAGLVQAWDILAGGIIADEQGNAMTRWDLIDYVFGERPA